MALILANALDSSIINFRSDIIKMRLKNPPSCTLEHCETLTEIIQNWMPNFDVHINFLQP